MGGSPGQHCNTEHTHSKHGQTVMEATMGSARGTWRAYVQWRRREVPGLHHAWGEGQDRGQAWSYSGSHWGESGARGTQVSTGRLHHRGDA